MTNKRKSRLLIGGFILILTAFEVFYDWQFGDGNGKIEYNHVFETLLFIKFALVVTWFSAVKKNVFLINVSVFLLLWGVLELGFALFINQPKIQHLGGYTEDFVLRDETLGYLPRPSTTASSLKIFLPNSDTIYHVNYSIDSLSRRKTPVNPSAKQHAIFFGGSFTFGEGLHDEESIPALFSELDSSFQTYNYGFCGYGPQQMLAAFENRNLADEVKEKNGICIFSFIDNHVNRANGFMQFINHYGIFHPQYILDNQSVVRHGNFQKNMPFGQKVLYRVLDLSNILNYFQFDLPLSPDEKHWQLTAKIIEKGFAEYEKQFAETRKILVIFPGETSQIVSYLEDESIEIFDFSSLFSRMEYRLHPYDAHTSKAGNQLIAKQLVEMIQ